MFGNLKPDLPNLYMKDLVLYKSLYCGLCKSIGGACGNVSRFSLNYEMTFYNAFLHNLKGVDVSIKKERCAAHWITTRPIAKPDSVSETISYLNAILTHYKIEDDIVDKDGGKLKSKLFDKAYKKSLAAATELDAIVKKYFALQLKMEKSGAQSIDIAADPFSMLLQEVTSYILQQTDTQYIRNLCYNIGKWTYLIDALADYNEDIKKKRYNPFVLKYNSADFAALIAAHRGEIEEIFGGIFYAIRENNNSVKYNFNHDLIDNILYFGIPSKTKQIIECEGDKCKTKDPIRF